MEENRRKLLKNLIGTIATIGSFQTLATLQTSPKSSKHSKSNGSFFDNQNSSPREYFLRCNALAYQLLAGDISQVEWQIAIETAFSKVDIIEFKKQIEFEKLIKNLQYPSSGWIAKKVNLENFNLASNQAFLADLMCFRPKGGIPAHGHNNVVVAYHGLQSKLYYRNWERVVDERGYVIVTPTQNRTAVHPGQTISTSGYRDNIHDMFAGTDSSAYFLKIQIDHRKFGNPYHTHNKSTTFGVNAKVQKKIGHGLYEINVLRGNEEVYD